MRIIEESQPPAPVRRKVSLSARQRQVLGLAAQGLSQGQIAELLGLRFYTVSEHLKQVYRKLGVHNRAAAVAAAMRRGWITAISPDTPPSIVPSAVAHGRPGVPENRLGGLHLCPCCRQRFGL